MEWYVGYNALILTEKLKKKLKLIESCRHARLTRGIFRLESNEDFQHNKVALTKDF